MNKPATNDPIVAKVRAAREEHAARFGFDVKAIFKDLRARQASSGRKYVRYPARPTTVKTSPTAAEKHLDPPHCE
jgi:hypothetical protein